jgi:hypothetical protein
VFFVFFELNVLGNGIQFAVLGYLKSVTGLPPHSGGVNHRFPEEVTVKVVASVVDIPYIPVVFNLGVSGYVIQKCFEEKAQMTFGQTKTEKMVFAQ